MDLRRPVAEGTVFGLLGSASGIPDSDPVTAAAQIDRIRRCGARNKSDGSR